ncbi:MAG: 2OG-Fe(II) oxygenase [Bacteroidota bacterium]
MNYLRLSDRIHIIEDFLSLEECKQFIGIGEETGYEIAHVDEKVKIEVRNNDRVFYESSVLSESLFSRLRPCLPPKVGYRTVCGLNERFRLYRYRAGHRFRGHQDGSFIRSATEASYFTCLLYLNEDFEGGQTTFIDQVIQPKTGMALIFWHKLWHEGQEVTSGEKHVLRTDVMYRD